MTSAQAISTVIFVGALAVLAIGIGVDQRIEVDQRIDANQQKVSALTYTLAPDSLAPDLAVSGPLIFQVSSGPEKSWSVEGVPVKGPWKLTIGDNVVKINPNLDLDLSGVKAVTAKDTEIARLNLVLKSAADALQQGGSAMVQGVQVIDAKDQEISKLRAQNLRLIKVLGEANDYIAHEQRQDIGGPRPYFKP